MYFVFSSFRKSNLYNYIKIFTFRTVYVYSLFFIFFKIIVSLPPDYYPKTQRKIIYYFDNVVLEKQTKFISNFKSIFEKVIYFKPHF